MKVAFSNWKGGKKHFGCKLVGSAFKLLCAERDMEIVSLDKADLVIVNAEGSIHDGANENQLDIAKEMPAVLINGSMTALDTVTWEDLAAFQLVTVREHRTCYELDGQLDFQVRVVPDVIFKHLPEIRDMRYLSRSGIFESCSSNKTGPPHATANVKDPEYVKRLMQSKGACLGRFHGIAVASMADVPFSAFAANTHKNLGIMEDMGVPQHYHQRYESASRFVPGEVDERVQQYAERAHREVNGLFDRIAEL